MKRTKALGMGNGLSITHLALIYSRAWDLPQEVCEVLFDGYSRVSPPEL